MAEYEVQWQTQEMWENDEWGTHYHDSWKEAITEAWEMRYNPDYVTIQVYEIHCVTFKDDNREEE